MVGLQEFIHKFEEGEGVRVVKLVAASLALLALIAVYDLRAFKNFSAAEAMEAAQLGRNLAEHRGFTTQCIRPLSMHLVQQHQPSRGALLKEGHPDLSNPPLYPLLLAGLMKVAPFHYSIPDSAQLQRFQPDFLIGLFNQLWFFAAVILLYFLAKRLFDAPIAWLAAAIMALSDLLWRFSISGLSTMLLMVIFLGLVWCLVRLDEGFRGPEHRPAWYLGWAAAAGVLVGLGMMTRYSFGALILPVLVFLAAFAGARRSNLMALTLVAFGLVITPWLVRNSRLSGAPFGTAGYAVAQETIQFSGTTLERSLNPDPVKLRAVGVEEPMRKTVLNLKEILQSDLPKLGGSWLSALFLAGLLVPFKKAALSRLRMFLLLCLACLAVAQALGRTHLSSEEGEVSTENLLVLTAPLVFMFGAAMYHLMLAQIEVPVPEVRRVITLLVGIVLGIPLAITMGQKTVPVAYPPYMPWMIQQAAGFTKPNELIMSDMPWAVAWYGRRQSVWLTLNPTTDFFAINDYQKPVNALYLTQLTMDSNFLTRFVKGDDHYWGRFILGCLLQGKPSPGFPLRNIWAYLVPDQLFVADWERWAAPGQ